MQRWDSNPRTLIHESSPVTIRPGFFKRQLYPGKAIKSLMALVVVVPDPDESVETLPELFARRVGHHRAGRDGDRRALVRRLLYNFKKC